MLYFDTSALVKLFVQEEGTENLIRYIDQQGKAELAMVSLAKVEFHSAVQRRFREGNIDQGERDTLMRSFETRTAQLFVTQPTNDAVISLSQFLLGEYPLRAYDAIQLAGCLCLQSVSRVFVCCDQRLLSAAQSEGLTTYDPTQ